ncbi:diguanylate cyclase domain-containing protein [Streptomyces swartbergensis]|uniref:diguanylate cyclase domain-containing protein n=1 Tax=Streptomyces swartbergensis TaxID=487165 RepID=UPI0037F333B7
MDLDHCKDINDSFGHPVDDKLLITVGHRLLGAARLTDTVARMGGASSPSSPRNPDATAD